MTTERTQADTKSRTLAGDLSLMDEAVVKYHAAGYRFVDLLNYYLDNKGDSEKYMYCSPNYLVLAEVMDHEKYGRHWHVAYAASKPGVGIRYMMDLVPFKLDIISFCRYRNIHNTEEDIIKYYKWDLVYKHGT